MAQTTVRESATERSAEEGPRRRPWWRRRVVGLSALVAACAVAVQWIIMTPPLYYDPYYVFEGARRWPDIPLDRWPFNEVPHQVSRIGLLLPARLMQELLGPGQAAYFAMAALGGIVFYVGCYLLVRSLFGDRVGLPATLLLMVHPFFLLTNPFGEREITWSMGVMLPDMPGAGLFAAGVAGLVVASRRTGRRQTALLVAAGLCMGCAFLIRDFAAFMYVGIPVFFRLLGISWRRLWAVAAPMLGVLAVSMIHNQLVWGNAMSAIRSAAGHGGEPSEPVTRMLALRSFERAMTDWHPLGWVFVVLLLLNAVGWIVTRDRRLALTLVWFVTLAVPLTLLSGLTDPHHITLRGWLLRYWFPVLPAFLAGGLGALTLLLARVPAARVRTGLAVACCALAGAYVPVAVAQVPDLPRDNAWNELRGWLDGRDDLEVIWSDHRLAQTLTFYTRDVWGREQWHGRIRSFPHEYRAIPVIAEDGPFLFTRWRGMEPAMVANSRLTPQNGYRRLWRSSDGLLEIWAR
ncbi:ArnT family glycosyltransferase [Thermomonospora cellulosilytica]|uniref:Glycosyltransferase RgtA/B/C/D-like domain-containing protein n=1 Tax=Thermomonospora cellulosilytica TaxID=1411118 RepID=A0A7W3R8Q0_9ACTN|nr:glycosyltransferase family 39 protein [Thermomonospora cellulosilytica]MBA9003525.1 hypothetical protein [Thermomonospora cellulosilytica]